METAARSFVVIIQTLVLPGMLVVINNIVIIVLVIVTILSSMISNPACLRLSNQETQQCHELLAGREIQEFATW